MSILAKLHRLDNSQIFLAPSGSPQSQHRMIMRPALFDRFSDAGTGCRSRVDQIASDRSSILLRCSPAPVYPVI
jgi:hypothetical protein